MKNFTSYTEKAKNELNLPSDYALAKLLGIKQPSLINMKQGKSRPSEETMLKLAILAKVDAKEALIDLAIWRAEDKGYSDVKNVWKSISKFVSVLVFFAFLTLSATSSAIASDVELSENKMCTKLGIQISNNYKLCDKLVL